VLICHFSWIWTSKMLQKRLYYHNLLLGKGIYLFS
jgi:hypothetical protein